MTTWFSSDLHFGHRNIIKYCGRPFATVEEMNAALIATWNARVRPGDVVWVLGDVVMGKVAENLPLLGALNGELHLIAGNHDRCWGGDPKGHKWVQRYLDAGFRSVADTAWIDLHGRAVQLHHFPFAGDSHGEDRYSEHRPVDHGHVLLHGHVHDAWQVNGRQINVGCDVWGYGPISSEALDLLAPAP